ncbi:hypothetical protein KY284_026465 [Solanum tuberosum]|nr:hypothetical protein KY284_026465 [Solanum tuberosum]
MAPFIESQTGCEGYNSLWGCLWMPSSVFPRGTPLPQELKRLAVTHTTHSACREREVEPPLGWSPPTTP